MRLQILITLLSGLSLYGQKNNFNLVFGFGASYFFNDKTLNRQIDHTKMIGINYLFNPGKQAFRFNPGISFRKNSYSATLMGSNLVHVNQATFNLDLDVLMKMNSKVFLRAGIQLSHLINSVVYITRTDLSGRQYYGYGNEQMTKNYFPTSFQAGINTGLCFPFKILKREQKFDVKVLQSASSLVSSDFSMTKAVAGEDIKVLSARARPTMLILCWEISLQKKEKKIKTEEE